MWSCPPRKKFFRKKFFSARESWRLPPLPRNKDEKCSPHARKGCDVGAEAFIFVSGARGFALSVSTPSKVERMCVNVVYIFTIWPENEVFCFDVESRDMVSLGISWDLIMIFIRFLKFFEISSILGGVARDESTDVWCVVGRWMKCMWIWYIYSQYDPEMKSFISRLNLMSGVIRVNISFENRTSRQFSIKISTF